MRPHFGQAYIRTQFDRIGDELDAHLELYLIGGGSMAFRGLKDATKDVDVVVTDGRDFARLMAVLTELGYEEVRDPGDEYDELGATCILENEDDCRFDVFNRQVADRFIFSEGMRARSEPLDVSGDLIVSMASAEDVFLFKSVTPRADDRDDMNTLLQSGLDFDAILGEIETQADLLDEELFVTRVNEGLLELEDRFGVTPSLSDAVAAKAADVYDQLAVLQAFDDTTTKAELSRRTELSEQAVEVVLRDLESKGNVERDGDHVRKLDERP